MKEKMFLIPLIMIFLFGITSAYTWNSTLENGLVNWYSFENSLNDNLSLNNGVNSGSVNTSGILGSGRLFDGTSNYINVSLPSSFTSNIMYSFWIKTNRTGASGDGDVFFIKETTGSDIEWASIVGLEIKYWFQKTGGSQTTFTTSGANLQINTWYNVVINGSGDSNNYFIWINGVNQSVSNTGAVQTRPTGIISNFQLGGSTINSKFFQGANDEFSIYNRTGNNLDIAMLYNNGSGCTYKLCDIPPPPVIPPVLKFNYSITSVCDNCTNVNITKIIYPNGTIVFNNLSMSKFGTNYNYTFSSDLLGKYDYITCGDLNGITTCDDTQPRTFTLKDAGVFTLDFTSTITIIILIIVFIFAIFLYVIGQKIFTAFIMFIIGFLMLFNDVNVVISVIFILFGFVSLFERSEDT